MNEKAAKLSDSHGDQNWMLKDVADPEICEINPAYLLEAGKPYPFVPMENVQEQCEGISGFETRVLDSGGYTTFKNGDILFAKITPCTENGKIAMVRDMPNEVGFGSTEFIVFSPNPAIDSRFLFYQLTRGDIRSLCSSLMEGTTGRQRVPISIFRKRVQIAMPHYVREQTSIADRIEQLDHVIVAVRATISKAERLQKALMQQLLNGRLRPDGTLRRRDDFWIDSKLGFVPKGWIVEKGWKIAEKITKGQSPKWQGFDYTTSGMLFVTSENVREGYLDLTSSKFLPIAFHEKIKGSELKFGDILINLVGASIGRSCVFLSDYKPANINQAVCLFRPRPGIVSGYLGYYLRLPATLNRLLSSQVETARANLSLADIRRLKFALPEDEGEQKAIAERLDITTSLIEAKRGKIVALKRLKKSLMQNLLTGRIRLPIDKLETEGKSK